MHSIPGVPRVETQRAELSVFVKTDTCTTLTEQVSQTHKHTHEESLGWGASFKSSGHQTQRTRSGSKAPEIKSPVGSTRSFTFVELCLCC